MADVFDKAKRSEIMSRIRCRDTRPETAVRSMLHRMGFRFRLHRKDLPGKPDIVLPRHKTVIFVHGCFWHRHRGCKFAYMPKTRQAFWQTKLEGNAARDRKVKTALTRAGWRVVVVWECELRNLERLARRVSRCIAPPRAACSP